MRDVNDSINAAGHITKNQGLRGGHREQTQTPVHEPLERVKPNKKYACFEDAHRFAKSLGLATRKEWRQYVKGAISGKPEKQADVPSHPDGIYKTKGWQGWRYWLGTAEQDLLQ